MDGKLILPIDPVFVSSLHVVYKIKGVKDCVFLKDKSISFTAHTVVHRILKVTEETSYGTKHYIEQL